MYKALRTFTGLVCMVEGEVKDIPDKQIAWDLLNCGYIVAVEEKTPAVAEETPAVKEPKPRKKKTPKGE